MNRDRLLAVSLGLTMMSTAAIAQDDPFDNRWYTGVSGGLVWPDSNRMVDNKDFHYGLNVGKFFTPAISVDFRIDRYTLNYEMPTPGISQRNILESYGLVGRYHFREGQDTRPYVLFGLGLQNHDNVFDEGRDMFASIGAGITHAYSDRWSVRVEAELRHDNDRDTFNSSSGSDDLLVSMGLNYSFGERPRAPAPVAEPEPVREPVRRPAPRPAPAPEPAPEPEMIFEFSAEVAFPLDSATLQPAAVAELNEAIELLSMHPELTRVQVGGHTCDLGDADYNRGLSQRRAQSVHDYMVENGIDDDRLSVRGFGETRPKVPNSSDSNRRENRRVELRVIERSDR